MNEQGLVYRLRKRAEILRQIKSRKSAQEGKPDRIADLLEEAAAEIERLRKKPDRWSKYTLDELTSQCDLCGTVENEKDIVSPVTDSKGMVNKPESPVSIEDMKIQSIQSLKEEMLSVVRGERRAPDDAGKTSFESVEIASRFIDEINRTTEQVSSAIDEAITFVDASTKRIDAMECVGVICYSCGVAKLVHGSRDVPYSYKGQSTILAALTGNYCPACSSLFVDLDEARRAMNLTLEFRNKVDGK